MAVTAQQQVKWIRRAKPFLFVACLVPIALVGWDLYWGQIVEPVDHLTAVTGEWALRFLILTLLVTPTRWITGWNALVRVRRMIGLFAFFYALIHALIWLVLDQGLSVSAIASDIVKRKYIFVGFAAFVIMTALAITSPAVMVRRLGGKAWQKLHRTVYVAAIAAALHFIWLAKAEHAEPFVYAAVIIALLAVRFWHSRKHRRRSQSKTGRTQKTTDEKAQLA